MAEGGKERERERERDRRRKKVGVLDESDMSPFDRMVVQENTPSCNLKTFPFLS